MPARKLQESRDRNRPLKVLVSERERAEIETRAAATGLSVSAFLRNLGLGFQPQSTLDHEAILALLKVNADQGRLALLISLAIPLNRLRRSALKRENNLGVDGQIIKSFSARNNYTWNHVLLISV